jgi:GWxTD domain-containing protein
LEERSSNPLEEIMKRLLVCFFSCLLFINFSSPYLSAQKEKYKRWLNEEVYWIITKEEESAFKKLTTDQERDKFIALFWAKRDPNPLDEKNEFKKAFYSRLDYVNLKYTRGQDMGWKTDIGKILIFFGLPKERRANPETWTYKAQPWMRINEDFQVVFDISEDEGQEVDQKKARFVLNERLTSKVALDAMSNYAQRTIFNPQLTEVPKYAKKFVLEPESFEGKIIEKMTIEIQEHMDIPFEHSFNFTKAERGSTRISLVCFLDPKEAALEKAILFGRAQAEDGTFEDFQKKIKVEKSDNYIFTEFPVMPRKYELYFGLKDENSERYSVMKQELDVPNFWTDQLNLGNIILTDKVEMITPGSREACAFNFGQYYAIPKKGNVYKKSDTLNILYQIYNAKIENKKVKLLQEIFIQKEQKKYKLPGSVFEREVPQGQVIVSGFPIPLSPIEPGEFDLIIKITDQLNNNVVEKTSKIVVVEK